MSKLGVIYDRASGRILGYIGVSQDSDLRLNYDPTTQELLELPVDHQSQYEQEKWEIRDKALRRKPNV